MDWPLKTLNDSLLPMNPDDHPLLRLITDPDVALPHRAMALQELLAEGSPGAQRLIQAVLKRLAENSGTARVRDRARQLEKLLKEMEDGPKRTAVFVDLLPQNGLPNRQALVILDDGTPLYPVLARNELAESLRRGETVVLDAKGRAVLQRAGLALELGDVARLERRIDHRSVEVLFNGYDRKVMLVSQSLMDQLEVGKVQPGAAVVVSLRQSVAFAALPNQDGLSHYRFLLRAPVPDVIVERDIGAPPRCIDEVTEHIRAEMLEPELRRRYGLRRCLTKLLCGVSGSGKSLAIKGIQRRMADLMAEATGLPLDQLPPRVIWIRPSQILSQWLGESEKHWERALDEAEQLADETFTARDGRKLHLPVLVVLEEIDGLGRARGQEAIQDRILSSVLQRLDPNNGRFADRLLILLATTNTPHLVDAALLRRLGGTIEHFGWLRRKAFMAVLDKHVRGLPVAAVNGDRQDIVWGRHVQDLGAWFFSPNSSDPGLVELTYAGSTSPVVKRRRDFLTGALVDRAVQRASAEAVQCELAGIEPTGITGAQLFRAFEDQFQGIADQLTPFNVGNYTDLPDGVRVASIRRLPRPDRLPQEFEPLENEHLNP